MNRDERIVESYLKSLQLGEVVYEPDGKVPPDFLVDGRIAVEARRLNQHFQVEGESRGLEEDSIPLRQALENLLEEFGSSSDQPNWFVSFQFRRPILDRKELMPQIRAALHRFLQSPADETWYIPINDRFELTIVRGSKVTGLRFLIGGYDDMDAGGWVVSEIVRNLSTYVVEKTQKVAPYRSKYPIWWLIFVDYIGWADDEAEVRRYIERSKEWDRVLLLNPGNERAYEI